MKAAVEGEEVERYIEAVQPEDHTDDYSRVIEMLAMTTAEDIELSQDEFEKYVRDKWEWSAHAYASNSMYANLAKDF